MEYFEQLRDSHSQYRDCNELHITLILTELIDIYRYKITEVEPIHKKKKKKEVRELPPLLQN